MPDDPLLAVQALVDGGPVDWDRTDLERLRAVIDELHVGVHRRAALARLDALLAEE